MKLELIYFIYKVDNHKRMGAAAVVENVRAYLHKVGTMIDGSFLISDAYKKECVEQLAKYTAEFKLVANSDEFFCWGRTAYTFDDDEEARKYLTMCFDTATLKHKWKMRDKAITFRTRHGDNWAADKQRRKYFQYVTNRLNTMRPLINNSIVAKLVTLLDEGIASSNADMIATALEKLNEIN